ncbi:MAG TPA: nucleoside deaminase [Holophaga sp.]|nr:nucleoside deaminase [Holophaga sp.]
MCSDPLSLHLPMPEWAAAYQAALPESLPDVEQRMRIVLELASLNFERNTGGPFAAGVFERGTGRLVALGVNRVVASGCSSAHAEVMALGLAQKRLGTYDLGGPEQPEHELVVNWRPCAMCYGAVLWSGVRHLTIAGSGSELEELTGFDEGPVHPEWKAQLAARGIETHEGVLRAEAVDLFRRFKASARIVYNPRQGAE